MEHYIPKSTLVAEIERKIRTEQGYSSGDAECGYRDCAREILSFIDTLEVKEIGIAIPNIDDLFEEDGIDPNSKDVKLFKECYYSALERYKEKKGIV